MDKVLNTLKEGVLKTKPYTLKPEDAPIKLNQNESPYDLPDEIKDNILKKLKNTKWNIYPDFIPDWLYEKTAKFFNLSKENILIGNGSNEMIFTILAATLEKGKNVIIPVPSFAVYSLISSNINANIIKVPLNEDFLYDNNKILEHSKVKGSVTIICSPNNPTGTCMDKDSIENVINASGGIVIVDEAYIHFGGESVIDLIKKYDNLIILRTFSKAFGLAGLRIGMMVSNPALIKELSKVKLPYNINVFTMITLNEIFDNTYIFEDNVTKILNEKLFLERELKAFKDLKVIPSKANFFLIKFKDENLVFNELLKDGILIRDYSKSPMLENYMRISVGNHEENLALLKSLHRILG